MTKTLTALTALAFAVALAGGAAAQATGGSMPADKMAGDHMMKKDGAMVSGDMKKDGAMKADATKTGAAMKKPMKKAKKPMAGAAMASDSMAKK